MAASPMPIFDNHLHLSPTGQGVAAAKRFQEAGGTALLLVHLPHFDLPLRTVDDFGRGYDTTLAMAERVRRETGLKVWVAAGPYPVHLVQLAKERPLAEIVALMREGMDAAADLAAEHRIVAIGEIGRPHFPVDPTVLAAANEVMEYGMARARDRGCPVLLHTEEPTTETFLDLAQRADRAGLRREKVVKHYSTPLVTPAENHGLMPSVLATKEWSLAAAAKGDRFFFETDYLDDPRRPGAVLGPATVPRRTHELLAKGLLTDAQTHRIHVEWPAHVYGIEVE